MCDYFNDCVSNTVIVKHILSLC